MYLFKNKFLRIAAACALVTVVYAAPGSDIASVEARMDSLAEYAASTTVGKDDQPISMSGDLTSRLRNYHFRDYNPLFSNDKARSQVDANLNVSLMAVPNSYINFWTILNFPFDFTGYYLNNKANEPYIGPNVHDEKMLRRHGMDYYSTTLWEESTAGIDVRGGGFAAMFKAGGVLWVNSSPLTVWEREAWPKFPSTFETFEEERTVSTYYKEKSFRPVMEGGRAFWTNRSFGGIMLDAYKMPLGFTGHLLLAQPKDNDFGTRDGLRLLAGQTGEAEMSGTLDFRGDIFHGRLANENLGEFTLGANYLSLNTDRGVLYEQDFRNSFGSTKDPYLTDMYVASLDVKGNVLPKLYLTMDVALSLDDSTVFRKNPSAGDDYTQEYFTKGLSKVAPAVYAKIESKYGVPITTELSYISQDFYSPYGMTDYSRNRTWRKEIMPLGAGAFRYAPNMAGANIKIEPDFNRGRFNLLYAQHRQTARSQNILSFPFRLNGRFMSEAYMGWSKYNSALFFNEADGNTYQTRLAGKRGIYLEDERGGLRGGTWELWEYFGSFESASDARDMVVPKQAKWANSISVDMGYDIGHWFGTDRNIMMAAIASISGLSKKFMPITYGDKPGNLMLWTFFLQAEPTFAITSNLHGMLIGGVETFRAPDAYASNVIDEKNNIITYEKLPINFLQTAIGFGIDWDFTSRAGLHLRYRFATHSDETMPENDWKAHFVTAETKVWF
ncbi:MAG: hypothetical protein GX801_09200 [Fibrobacter sp.]|nr:hypothetical protein [Fibrobacter sp.]